MLKIIVADLRGLSVVHFDFRNEVRYVWAWQWVRQ